MLRNTRFHSILAAAALAALALGSVQAQAHSQHAKLMTSTPAADSSVASPKSIVLTFNQEIAPNLSRIKLTDAGGQGIASMRMPAPDAKSLSFMPTATLPAGLYTVSWMVVSADGDDKTSGTYTFTVK